MAAVTLSTLLFLVTTTTTHSASASTSNLIKQTCKQTPDYNLCVSSLTADPRGPKAKDVDTLALIMIDAVNNKATATSKEIARLLNCKPALRKPLKTCATVYEVITEADVAVAIRAVRLGDPKFGEGAMNDARDETDGCEGGFAGGKSPLTDMNTAVYKVADVASAVIRQLL